MNTVFQIKHFSKSAYIALLCLIAFVIVITICIIKQFIWDPLLSKYFEILQLTLSESIRKFSSSFYRSYLTQISFSLFQSVSDIHSQINDPPSLLSKNNSSVTQSSPSNVNSSNPIKKHLSYPSYGSSSLNLHAHTNYGFDHLLVDQQTSTPTVYVSFQYNPSTYNVKLNVQYLRHMNKFHNLINSNSYILVRFILSPATANEPYETTPKPYQEFIRFGETFTILNNIQPTDVLDYKIKFSVILVTNGNTYEIAVAMYSMKNDYLNYILFIEKKLPMDLKLTASGTK